MHIIPLDLRGEMRRINTYLRFDVHLKNTLNRPYCIWGPLKIPNYQLLLIFETNRRPDSLNEMTKA